MTVVCVTRAISVPYAQNKARCFFSLAQTTFPSSFAFMTTLFRCTASLQSFSSPLCVAEGAETGRDVKRMRLPLMKGTWVSFTPQPIWARGVKVRTALKSAPHRRHYNPPDQRSRLSYKLTTVREVPNVDLKKVNTFLLHTDQVIKQLQTIIRLICE